MRTALLISIFLCGACASREGSRAVPVATASASAATPPAAKPAPIVVALVVDQLGAWIAAERFPELPKTGGFARLVREGTYARDMRYAHAVTETSPGHAALFTGAAPHRSGVYANETIDDHTHHRQSSLRDKSVKTISPFGVDASSGIGLGELSVETVADVLRARAPKTSIVALSLKDRGAVFAAGRHPDAALWYETRRDAFVTSSAFAKEFPAWARFIDDGALPEMRKEAWTLLDPAFVSSHAKQPDAQPGESEVFGFGSTFPHAFSAARFQTIAFRASPRGDDALFRLASAAIDARDETRPMFLAISLSSFDYVGHFYGPDSWEAWDELARLDRSLAGFFQLLDRKVGADGWSAVLSGDHGGPPLPELGEEGRPWCKDEANDFWQRPCKSAGRLFPDALHDSLEQAAAKTLGQGDWVLGVASPYVFYTRSAAELPLDRRKKLDDAITAALLSHPEIDRVFPPRGEKECPPESDESIDALVCRSLWTSNKDALYVLTKKGAFIDTEYDLGKGVSHGGPYLFDRSVPLIVRAPGRVRPGSTIAEPIGFAAYARTLAALLGVPAPSSASEAKEIVPPATR